MEMEFGLSPWVNAVFAVIGGGLTLRAWRQRNQDLQVVIALFFTYFAICALSFLLEATTGPSAMVDTPSAGETVLIAALLPYAWALRVLVRRICRFDGADHTEGLIFGIGVALSVWILGIDPAMEERGLPAGRNALLLADILANLVIVTAVGSAMIRVGFRNSTLNAAAAACAIFTLSSVTAALSYLSNLDTAALLVTTDALQNISYVALGAALLYGSRIPLDAEPKKVRSTHPAHVFVLFVIPLVVPLDMLIISQQDNFADRTQNDPYDLVYILAAQMIITTLVAIRVVGLLRNEQLLSRKLDDAYKEIQTQDVTLRHSQKMEAIGRLAAGVAHEINTPIQFIGLNLEFLQTQLREASTQLPDSNTFAVQANEAIDDSLDGIQHIGKIVSAVKAFGHPGTGDKLIYANVNHLIENTLVVAGNSINTRAEIIRDLGEIPPVNCSPTELSQVFLNLIVNAADAIENTGRRGIITIRTYLHGDHLVISVSDTGTGMTPDVMNRAFEPMFTTKDVGAGSGLGLALAWSTVVDQHQGAIACDSIPGLGTTFTIHLPLRPATTG
jgi:signal transduction histidine kinase